VRQVAGSYAALASLLRCAGRRGEALTYARVSLEAKERAFPPDHPEIAAALLALADALRDAARSPSLALVWDSCHAFIFQR